VYAVFAIGVLAIAGMMSEENTGSVPPPLERWRDDAGNVYSVTRIGDDFDGVAENVTLGGVAYGHVEISGVLDNAGGNIVMENDRGIVFRSVGAAVPGSAPQTTDAVFGNLRFHINH
jgi:hypothetical protein